MHLRLSYHMYNVCLDNNWVFNPINPIFFNRFWVFIMNHIAGDMHLIRHRPILFYDGGCPLCRREIDHYRRLDRVGRVQWLDIAAEPDATAAFGLSWEAAMHRMHILEIDGRFVSGAYAFAVLLQRLPYYRALAALVSIPGVLWLLDKGYKRFARRRWQSRCDNACNKQ